MSLTLFVNKGLSVQRNSIYTFRAMLMNTELKSQCYTTIAGSDNVLVQTKKVDLENAMRYATSLYKYVKYRYDGIALVVICLEN
jgi:hypothetical protein